MATTYSLISSSVLSTTASSVTFSSIPSTYTDLVLRISARSSRATFTDMTLLKYNSLSGSFSTVWMSFAGDANYTSSNNVRDQIYTGYAPGADQTSNTFNSAEVYIPNYAGSTYKPSFTFGASLANDTTGGRTDVGSFAGFNSTTDAITSLVLTLNSGNNFVANSSFYLYGIKKN